MADIGLLTNNGLHSRTYTDTLLLFPEFDFIKYPNNLVRFPSMKPIASLMYIGSSQSFDSASFFCQTRVLRREEGTSHLNLLLC